ncbi:PREDICTED: zinc finger protein MSN2-like [Polistes dominula]|uniref:Zinc finger protein MSN2-like n=1 Tax=Polistes dominula TaxID=743375 RepID=A0ABM1IGF7_POLDO|nr:PREDICTED: zinc finger protein MSN2-like [Polistes dominula]
MAYTSLPQFISLNPLSSNNVEKTLSEILQSEPVRRLLNQPNIIIKTVPLNNQPKSNLTSNATNSSTVEISTNVYGNKNNGTHSDLSRDKQSELTIHCNKSNKDENVEDENLLPSKTEGKSEISLLPIRRRKKDCGHCEPCENITCDVIVEQCIDNNGISLMLAFNIDECEIDAPVSKHCKNSSCDALSIDHDRCRRAIIGLNRYDKDKICDICGVRLKTLKSRVHHKNCKRRNEYRHNKIDSTQLLKERMRERELQMLENAKAKKQDYMDPITGYNRAMDFLRNNDELIIIPKTQSPNQSGMIITSSSNQINQQQTDNIGNMFSSKFPLNIPLVFPQQNIVLNKNAGSNETNALQTNITHIPDSKPIMNTSITTIPNKVINLTNSPQTDVQTILLNDWLLSQSHIITDSSLNSKPFITPIRVVPITNLITQPSLLHQTQGIPKFCIMADNSLPALTVPDIKPVISPKPVDKPSSNLEENPKKEELPKRKRSGVKKNVRKRNRKKDLKCNYCNKHFSTDWYFKIHIAMHSGEKPFTCRLCEESFSNRYDLKKHVTSDHKNESINCNDCDFICTSYSSLDKHMKTHSHKSDDYDPTLKTINDFNSNKQKCNSHIETDINNTTDIELNSKEIKKEGKKNHDNSNNLCNINKEKCVHGTDTKKLHDANKKSIKMQEKQKKVSLEETNGVKVNGADSLP